MLLFKTILFILIEKLRNISDKKKHVIQNYTSFLMRSTIQFIN